MLKANIMHPGRRGLTGEETGAPNHKESSAKEKKKKKKFRHEKLTEAGGGGALPVLREQSHQIHNAGITW